MSGIWGAGWFVRTSVWDMGQGQVCADKVLGYRAGGGLCEQGSGCYTAASLVTGTQGGAGLREQGSGCSTATSLASGIQGGAWFV